MIIRLQNITTTKKQRIQQYNMSNNGS